MNKLPRSYYYLASPYSHIDKAVMHQRYLDAEHALSWLLGKKLWCYSPIVHCHSMAQRLMLPTDAAFWQDYNRAMMRASCGLLVLTIDGWVESVGVRDERAYAHHLGQTEHHVVLNGDKYIILMAV